MKLLISFVFLLVVYVVHATLNWFLSLPIFPKFIKVKLISVSNKIYESILSIIDPQPKSSFSRVYLIELSLKNMRIKRTRTLVTMGGMAIGIAFIVFLVSMGYGLENLVISRVVRLDELRQTDVAPGLSSELNLNDATIAKFKQIQNVKSVMPVIAVVGKISYQQSASDLAVYGVNTEYLKNSAIQPVAGKIFEDGGQNLNVLGVNTLPQIDVASSSADAAIQTKTVNLSSEARHLAVVSRSVLQVLNLTENTAVGKKVSLSFVVVGDLLSDPGTKLESFPAEYTIVGVTSDDGTPLVYVPFFDLRSLGIVKYSQLKIIVDEGQHLNKVRSAIEAAGYSTTSVVDTVQQIEQIFSSLRLLLAVVGLVALMVAALGMFNTLTVSLLERTREVGLMKAMGMKSVEVKELFLTESMIMGFYGGLVGLILGFLMGRVLSLILSLVSLSKGVGVLDVAYVPPLFVLAVLLLSIIVGVIAGYFPARRATKISALNALRYE